MRWHYKTLVVMVILMNSHVVLAKNQIKPIAYEADPQAQVLGQAGQIKIQREFCNTEGYNCDYVLYDAQGHREVLIEDWSRTANVYQFSPTLMGFLLGATGSGHILTVINAQNQRKDYTDFQAINEAQSCMVSYETGLKNMPHSLVFYSVPDFRVRLVLNNKVPQFKKFSTLSNVNFETNGDFRFEYTYTMDHELAIQNVVVQNPCAANYRIVMD